MPGRRARQQLSPAPPPGPAVVSGSDGDAQAGFGHFGGQDVAVRQHHGQPGPEVVEDPGPERVTRLEVVQMRADGHVGIEQEIGPLLVGDPARR